MGKYTHTEKIHHTKTTNKTMRHNQQERTWDSPENTVDSTSCFHARWHVHGYEIKMVGKIKLTMATVVMAM